MAYEALTKRLVQNVRNSLLFTASAVISDELAKRLTRKYAGKFSEGAHGLLAIAAVEVAGKNLPAQLQPVADDLANAMFSYGVFKSYKHVIEKEPVCWAVDANTLACQNLDSTTVVVKIDGATVGISKVEGTPDDMKIYLATALTPGEHELVVIAAAKAFYGKIYV